MTAITMPHDYKLERVCLSAIFRDFQAADEAICSIAEDDFFDPDHSTIFRLCVELHTRQEPITHLSIAALIDKPQGKLTWEYLLSVSNEFYSGIDYDSYYESLKNLNKLRKTIRLMFDTIQKSSQPHTNYEDIVGHLYDGMLNLESKSKNVIHPKEIFEDFRRKMSYIDYIDWRRERFIKGLPTYEGVSTGYPRLDATIGSFQNGGLYYIGARTSMGKTTFLLNLVSNIIKSHKVSIFSLEMDAQMILEKLLCIHADLKYSKFSTGNFTQEQRERILSLRPFFNSCSLWFDDQQGLNISRLVSRAHRLVKVYGVEIIFIDYLTLVRAVNKHPNKHMMVDEVSKGLQSLAKQLKIPIVVLAQLNRASAEETRPSLTSFRESGSIEEDADACLLIHRPEYYDPTQKPGLIEIIVAKNRIMGKLTTLEFNCNSQESERYYEQELTVAEQVKKINAKEEEDFDKQNPFFQK